MKDLHLLGLRVEDRVTGFRGVVTTISYDLYGCVQAIVSPGTVTENPGKLEDSRWFDTKRLKVLERVPVMDVPSFDNPPGGSTKSLPAQLPVR